MAKIQDRFVDTGTIPRAARIRGFVGRHRVAVVAAVILGIAGAVFLVAWFQPQKLIIEKSVNEAAPTSSDEVLARGRFRSLEHGTTGTAEIIELSTGERVLRFEDLDTSNGPDLRVFLSTIRAGNDARAYGSGFVDLGALKGNKGDQNYSIPSDIDLDEYRSAVIWCRRFTVAFGVAPVGSA